MTRRNDTGIGRFIAAPHVWQNRIDDEYRIPQRKQAIFRINLPPLTQESDRLDSANSNAPNN